MSKMKNNIYFSDVSVNGLPSNKQFMNNIFYLPNKEFYDFPLDKVELPGKTFQKYLNNINSYLIFSNYKYTDDYHHFDLTLGEKLRGVKAEEHPIDYKLNHYLFRSDHFKKEHDGLHILFAGCSETFGEGGQIEDNWSYRLYNKIAENNKVSGYYNVSLPGAGWDQIMQNVKRYIKLFGPPDMLYLLAPNLLRYFTYNQKNDCWQMTFKTVPIRPDKEYFLEYAERFPTWLFSIRNFFDYCESLGIKIVWTTWSTQENSNIGRTEYFEDSFFPIWNVVLDNINDIDHDLKYDDVSRRDGHHGNIYHTYITNEFIKELVRKNYIQAPNSYERDPAPLRIQGFKND